MYICYKQSEEDTWDPDIVAFCFWTGHPKYEEVRPTFRHEDDAIFCYDPDNYTLLKMIEVSNLLKARVTFLNCHKYSFNTMNDEAYFMGQYRYKNFYLPWGEFYRLNTNWQSDFPNNPIVITSLVNEAKLNHYIFFFKDNTFECVAQDYEVEFMGQHPIN